MTWIFRCDWHPVLLWVHSKWILPRQDYNRCFRHAVSKSKKHLIPEAQVAESFRIAFWTPNLLANIPWESAILWIIINLNSKAYVALSKTCELGQENVQTPWNNFPHLKNAVKKCLEFRWQMYMCNVTWHFRSDWHPVLLWVHCNWFSTTPMLLSLFSTCCRKIHETFNSRSRSC